LRLDGGVWLEVDIEGAEFDYPLGDCSSSFLIAEYVTEQVVGDDNNREVLEVVS
jgi:hypothetical protein